MDQQPDQQQEYDQQQQQPAQIQQPQEYINQELTLSFLSLAWWTFPWPSSPQGKENVHQYLIECTKIARFSAVAAAIFTAPPQNRAIFKAPRCAISSAKKIASERRFSLRLKGQIWFPLRNSLRYLSLRRKSLANGDARFWCTQTSTSPPPFLKAMQWGKERAGTNEFAFFCFRSICTGGVQNQAAKKIKKGLPAGTGSKIYFSRYPCFFW